MLQMHAHMQLWYVVHTRCLLFGRSVQLLLAYYPGKGQKLPSAVFSSHPKARIVWKPIYNQVYKVYHVLLYMQETSSGLGGLGIFSNRKYYPKHDISIPYTFQ